MTYEELFERLNITDPDVQDKIKDSFAEDEINAAKDPVSGRMEFNENTILTDSDDPYDGLTYEDSVTVLTKPEFGKEGSGFTAYALTENGDLIETWWDLPQGEEDAISVRADFGGGQPETKQFRCDKTDKGAEQLQDSMIEAGLQVPEDRREEFESLINITEETPDLKEFGITETISPASAGEMLEKAKKAGFIEDYDIGEIPIEERKATFNPAFHGIDAYDIIAFNEPEYTPGPKYENDRYLVKVLDKEQFGTEYGANLRQWCEEHGADKAVFMQKKPGPGESYDNIPAVICACDKESIGAIDPCQSGLWEDYELERYLDAIKEKAPGHNPEEPLEIREASPYEAAVLRMTDFATLDRVQNALEQLQSQTYLPEYGAEPVNNFEDIGSDFVRPADGTGHVCDTLEFETQKTIELDNDLEDTVNLTHAEIPVRAFDAKSEEEIFGMLEKEQMASAEKTDADEIVTSKRMQWKHAGVSADFADEEGFRKEVNDWKRCYTEELLTGYLEPLPKLTDAPVKKNEPKRGPKQDFDLE